MKIAANFLVSALAISALVAGAASHAATNLAELPLKAAVLAKPNVIFGMDDSGSMDWEVLLDTSSGMMWWNGSTAWDAARGKPLKSASSSRSFSYLFPVGSATGGQLYDYSSSNGRAIPPTRQFAWLRSAAFNPLYYDSNVTYKPWAPAYYDNANRAFGNAPTSAALAHPAYGAGPSLNLTTDWKSGGNPNFTNYSNEYTFTFLKGMRLPAADVSVASGSSNCPLGGTATGTCYAGVRYYPATFWHAEDCGVPDLDPSNELATCILAPDNVTKLQRYEIKPIGQGRLQGDSKPFPSGRSYADEIQNFANWFTYYRKRKLMLAASMGEVLENLTGLRMGVMRFTDESASTPTVTMYDIDNPSNSLNGRALAGFFYKNAMAQEGTPTHATVKHIAKQFNENTSIVQYACQRNSMFTVTDGFSNTASISSPPWSSGKSAATWGSGTPYQTTKDGTLADLALRYYTNRLRSDLPLGRVQPSASTLPNADKNPDLHITSYAISLGVRGSLWPTTVDPFATPPTWTTPTADDPSLIDDQWHATINGRGKMYLASNPTETANSIRDGLNDILDQVGAQGGVAVSTVNLQRGDQRAYFGIYNPAGWTGDLTANPINPSTGAVGGTAAWSAADQLTNQRAWGTRVIASHDGTSGVPFTAGSVGSLVNPGNAWGATSEVIDYLRGDRTHEGTKFRLRKSLIGAVINAEPVVARDEGVVYFASGEGMLHAIDTRSNPGEELWAYVPRAVLPEIGQTSSRAYVFKTQLDGTPVVGKTGPSSKLLVAGMGVAGRSYYAIDVSNPRGLSESQLAAAVKWEFPAAGDSSTQAKVGQTVGRPVIVRVSGGGYKVLVTSGYNDSHNDGKGRLWMLDPSTGVSEHVFEADAGGPDAGLAHVTPFVENDGSVKYVYGGDLRGNLWKFDLVNKPTAASRIAVLKDGSGNLQPITAAPELINYEGKRIVLVGTGRLLDITDFGKTSPRQSFYAIADGSEIPNVRSGVLVAHTYTKATDTTTTVTVDWASKRGWYMDLPLGEQANTQPQVARGVVTFVTNMAGATDCAASSYLYVLDVLTGNKYDGANFVGTQISATAMSSGVNLLLTSGMPPPPCTGAICPPVDPNAPPDPCQHIVGSGQDADGQSWKRDITQCVNITPSKNAWREVRR